MRMIAFQTLYYADGRRRAGTEFDCHPDDLDDYAEVAGKPPVALPATPENRARFEALQRSEYEKDRAAALYTSGSRGNARKRGFIAAMAGGPVPVQHRQGFVADTPVPSDAERAAKPTVTKS